MTGTLFGVGVGPGDPELVTLKAVHILNRTPVVGYFAKRGKVGNALTTASPYLPAKVERLPLIYPYTTEHPAHHPVYVSAMEAFYNEAAERIAQALDAGKNVSVLCEGDPLLYGSYMYLHDRLAHNYTCQVIPGICSFAGCAAAAGLPLVSTDRVFAIVPGTLPEMELERQLARADAVAIIKLGRNYPKVRRVLERTGRIDQAIYVERGTTDQQRIALLNQKRDIDAIYFSLILVPAHSGGPYQAPRPGAALSDPRPTERENAP